MWKTWAVVTAVLASACTESSSDFAGGLTITDIAILQGPIVPLVHDTAETTRTAPVLAGRQARFLVRFAFESGSEARDVTVWLTLVDDATGKHHAFSKSVTIPGGGQAAVDAWLDVDGSFITPATTYFAEVHEQHGFVSSHDRLVGVRQPAEGEWPLDAKPAPLFRAQIVPIATPISAAPEISQASLDAWRAQLVALWPIADAELSVAAPVTTALDMTQDGSWGPLLAELAAHRAAAGVDPDTFWYGAVPPTPKTGVGGIAASLVVELPYWRVASGQVNVNATQDAFIVTHELGHAVGRSHAPCGNPGGPDLAYPYPMASIGVEGLDIRDGSIRDPQHYVDFMSYCGPIFVSDYGFAALYESLTWLGTPAARVTAESSPPPFIVDSFPEVAR